LKATSIVAQKPKAKRPGGSTKNERTGPAKDRGKSQRERFIETAREIGVDETGEEFMRMLKTVAPPKRRGGGS
jgi:hypothetical protein